MAAIHRTPRWQRTRRAYVKHLRTKNKDYAVCTSCGGAIYFNIPAGFDDALEVDHIIEASVRPDLAHDFKNLQPLHRRCHKVKTFGYGYRPTAPMPVADSTHPGYPWREGVEHHADCTCNPDLPRSACW